MRRLPKTCLTCIVVTCDELLVSSLVSLGIFFARRLLDLLVGRLFDGTTSLEVARSETGEFSTVFCPRPRPTLVLPPRSRRPVPTFFAVSAAVRTLVRLLSFDDCVYS